MSLRIGYNTNGLAHHRLTDAIPLLADLGYRSVAITLDAGALDPFADMAILRNQVAAVRSALGERGLSCVVETGARFLLNPWLKHDPTLMDPDHARRQIRVDFLRRAIGLAGQLGAECVSLWSGALPDAISRDQAMERLVSALAPVLSSAEETDMVLAFEPEPGMFIDTMDRFSELDERVRNPCFQLTMDLGHVHCIEEEPVPVLITRWAPRIRNIHIEDMKRHVHEHLMFGEGTMDFPAIFQALHAVRFAHGIHVELSRHSHQGAAAARQAMAFLEPFRHPSAVTAENRSGNDGA